MNGKWILSLGMGVVLALGWVGSAVAATPPVAKLVDVQGQVEYSRNGSDWRPVRQTKYLFAGYQIRTGKDGSGDLVNQNTGEVQSLGSNSHVEVSADAVRLIAGNLSEPQAQSEGIFSILEGLANKFAKAQRYTTVRRNVSMEGDDAACDAKVRTPEQVTLSPDHPDLVWRNACPEFSYRLVIDAKEIPVSAQSTAEMIRVPVAGLDAGKHTYRVEVLDADGVVFKPKRDSELTWLSPTEDEELKAQIAKTGDDVFLKTDILESRNMHVAAMDAYRDYFNENPDDNEMRPLLIKIYGELNLVNLREQEARLYKSLGGEAE